MKANDYLQQLRFLEDQLRDGTYLQTAQAEGRCNTVKFMTANHNHFREILISLLEELRCNEFTKYHSERQRQPGPATSISERYLSGALYGAKDKEAQNRCQRKVTRDLVVLHCIGYIKRQNQTDAAPGKKPKKLIWVEDFTAPKQAEYIERSLKTFYESMTGRRISYTLSQDQIASIWGQDRAQAVYGNKRSQGHNYSIVKNAILRAIEAYSNTGEAITKAKLKTLCVEYLTGKTLYPGRLFEEYWSKVQQEVTKTKNLTYKRPNKAEKQRYSLPDSYTGYIFVER